MGTGMYPRHNSRFRHQPTAPLLEDGCPRMTSGANVIRGPRLPRLPAPSLSVADAGVAAQTDDSTPTHRPSPMPHLHLGMGVQGPDPRVYGILQPSPCVSPKSFEKFCQVRQLADSPASLIRGACALPVSSPVVLRAPGPLLLYHIKGQAVLASAPSGTFSPPTANG